MDILDAAIVRAFHDNGSSKDNGFPFVAIFTLFIWDPQCGFHTLFRAGTGGWDQVDERSSIKTLWTVSSKQTERI